MYISLSIFLKPTIDLEFEDKCQGLLLKSHEKTHLMSHNKYTSNSYISSIGCHDIKNFLANNHHPVLFTGQTIEFLTRLISDSEFKT